MSKNKYRVYLSRHFRVDCHTALKVIAKETGTTMEQALNEAVRVGIYHMTGIDLNRDRLEIS